MATTYSLLNADGETLKTGSKKQSLIKAAEDQSLLVFSVVTSSGTVVHEVDNRPAQDEVEDLIGTPEPKAEDPAPAEQTLSAKDARKIRLAESDASRDFHGNYSIATAPFAQTLAAAWDGIETEVENLPNSLTRRVHFYGQPVNIDPFLKVLDAQAEQVIVDLRAWQKANIEKRRGLTDMQKYLQHRDFIAKQAKKVAKQIKSGDLG